MVDVILVGLKWSGFDPGAGNDVHLLPGLASPRLADQLYVEFMDPSTGVVAPSPTSAVTLAFFEMVPGLPDGVTLDATSGEIAVRADATLPPEWEGRSFEVEVEATRDGHTATTRIRMYLHRAITKMWLTPGQITLRSQTTTRFSVLALFQDGVIGDISNWSQWEAGPNIFDHVHRVGSAAPPLVWSSQPVSPSPPSVSLEQTTGELRTTATSGEMAVTVTYGELSASGRVTCAEPYRMLAQQTRVTQVVPQGVPADVVGPGAGGRHLVPNVLFLPEGFQSEDQELFELLVRALVQRLTTRHHTGPFRHLRVNYWTAWVPSGDAGVSVLNELSPRRSSTVSGGRPVVYPVELPSVESPAGDWKLADMIHEVGLPRPLAEPPFLKLTDELVDQWQSVYGTHITRAKVEGLYDEWLTRGARMLVNEVDTAFHVACGERPRLDAKVSDRELGPHPRRDFLTFVDSFASHLKGPKGEALGEVWSRSVGKDIGLVVFLCFGRHAGVRTNSERGDDSAPLLVSLGDDDFHSAAPALEGKGFDLLVGPAADDVSHRVRLTVARELANEWTVGVESGGDTSDPSPRRIQYVGPRANLEERDRLVDQSGNLVADGIQWRTWPRIVKAGVLWGPIREGAAGTYVIDLTHGTGAGFVVGDIVRLRTRPLAQSLGHSGRFEVVAVNGDELTIVPLAGTVVDAATLKGQFPPVTDMNPGSIIFAAARALDPNPPAGQYGDDLMLMTDAVRQRINLTHNPLNAHPLAGEAPPPNDPVGRLGANVELAIPTAATNFPGPREPFLRRMFSAWTIGLYENGGTHNRGIYRPTGMCLMSTHPRRTPVPWISTFDFCLVCHYALVDWVNPERHGKVNAAYIKRYERDRP